MDSSQLAPATKHFEDHYEVASQYAFASCEKVLLNDHIDEHDRTYRFCGRGNKSIRGGIV